MPLIAQMTSVGGGKKTKVNQYAHNKNNTTCIQYKINITVDHNKNITAIQHISMQTRTQNYYDIVRCIMLPFCSGPARSFMTRRTVPEVIYFCVGWNVKPSTQSVNSIPQENWHIGPCWDRFFAPVRFQLYVKGTLQNAPCYSGSVTISSVKFNCRLSNKISKLHRTPICRCYDDSLLTDS